MKIYYKINFFDEEQGVGEFFVTDNGTHYNMVTPSGVEHAIPKFEFYHWCSDKDR